MLWNIVDNRTNRYCIDVDAVFEPAYHDNNILGASQSEVDDSWYIFAVYNTTVEKAIRKAFEYKTPTTVYLYDANSNPLEKN